MKNILLLLFFLCVHKTYSQNLNDRIFLKEGDSVLCKITKVETNWIYYDHLGKRGLRNDYIHMSDIKYYLFNGVKRKSYEYEIKSVVVNVDSSKKYIEPKDTIKSYYLDTLGKKQTCFILLYKSKNARQVNQFRKIEIIDSLKKKQDLFPSQIFGYWLNGFFYKSFKATYNKKNVFFFAEEIIAGKATLYSYNGEQLDNNSIYIFKKQEENNYHFLLEVNNLSDPITTAEIVELLSNGSTYDKEEVSVNMEQPYLDYFRSYFSDCNDVFVKFKSNWYSYNNVKTMFMDYNECK